MHIFVHTHTKKLGICDYFTECPVIDFTVSQSFAG